jgi:hypothetical protein
VKLVDRANKVPDAKELEKMTMLRQSYGGGGKEHAFGRRIIAGGNNIGMITFASGTLFGIGCLRLFAARRTKPHSK